MSEMSRTERDELRGLLAEATERPWFAEAHGIMDAFRSRTIVIVGDSDQDEADAALICAAVNDLPVVLDALDASEAANDALEVRYAALEAHAVRRERALLADVERLELTQLSDLTNAEAELVRVRGKNELLTAKVDALTIYKGGLSDRIERLTEERDAAVEQVEALVGVFDDWVIQNEPISTAKRMGRVMLARAFLASVSRETPEPTEEP